MMSNSSSNNSGCLILFGTLGAAIITALGVVGAAFITNVDKFAPKTVTASSIATPPVSIINNKPPLKVQSPSPAAVITPSPAVVIVDEAKILKENLVGAWKSNGSCSLHNGQVLTIERNITFFKNATAVENFTIKAKGSIRDPSVSVDMIMALNYELVHRWKVLGGDLYETQISYSKNNNSIKFYGYTPKDSEKKNMQESMDKKMEGFFSVDSSASYKVLHIDKSSMMLERIMGLMSYQSCNLRIIKLTRMSSKLTN